MAGEIEVLYICPIKNGYDDNTKSSFGLITCYQMSSKPVKVHTTRKMHDVLGPTVDSAQNYKTERRMSKWRLDTIEAEGKQLERNDNYQKVRETREGQEQKARVLRDTRRGMKEVHQARKCKNT